MSHTQTKLAKRGYLANMSSFPPIVYPFQYNPTEITDSKGVTWGKKTPIGEAQGAGRALSAAQSMQSLGGPIAGGMGAMGRLFSAADLHQFQAEGDRTIGFQLVIDGREQRPGEPDFRRQDGTILGDLAMLRSFVYPAVLEATDLLDAALGSGCDRWSRIWFNEPPTALLVLGDRVTEAFVSDLRITETMFNANLDPVRAEVSLTLIEKIDSLSFLLNAVNRMYLTTAQAVIPASQLTFHGISETPSRTGFPPKAYFQ